MNPVKSAVALLVSAFGVVAPAIAKDVKIDDIPSPVIEAVRNAVPGLELLKAEREVEWLRVQYEITGYNKKENLYYEIEVSPKGKVLDIEKSERPEGRAEEEEDKD